jgi:hypothetical protein
MPSKTRSKRALGDGIPAVLVREVRQALRSRSFRIAFLLVLTAGLVAAIAVASVGQLTQQRSESIGRQLFELLVGGLFLTCLVQVPHGAFASMSAEWEEDTYDLLAITNLGPRRIVGGKLVSSLLQALLHMCALTPVAVFCFLLRGVGLLQILVLALAVVSLCAAYSSIAIALASLSRNRVLRGVLQGLLLLGVIFFSIGLYEELNFDRLLRGISVAETWTYVGLLASLCVGATVLGVEVANARLSHPEENRSSGLRLAVCGIVLGFFAWLQGAMMNLSYAFEPLTYVTMALVAAGTIFASSFVTESEALGRRVRLDVPRQRWIALLTAPFLPGGARGLLLAALCFAAAFGYYCAVYFTQASALKADTGEAFFLLTRGPVSWMHDISAHFDDGSRRVGGGLPFAGHRNEDVNAGPFGMLLWISYLWLYLAIGRQIARLVPRSLRGLSIFTPIFFAILLVLLPSVLGVMLDDVDLRNAEHVGNPIWLHSRIGDYSVLAFQCAGLIITAAAITLVLHLRTLRTGVREVLTASADARRRVLHPVPSGVRPDARPSA